MSEEENTIDPTPETASSDTAPVEGEISASAPETGESATGKSAIGESAIGESSAETEPHEAADDIDLNELFPDEDSDLNELFPEPEMRTLLKKVQRFKKDLGKIQDRFVEAGKEIPKE